jgi:hypothetical protein
MLAFLLLFPAASERQLFGVAVKPLSRVPERVSSFEKVDADGSAWLAKAYGQNYEKFNELRGDSSGFVYDPKTRSYVPVLTHHGVAVTPQTAKISGSARPRWWSRVIVVAIGAIAIARRASVAAPLLRYAVVAL